MQAQRKSRSGGSAAVEFVLLAPFVVALSGVVWDLRAYISHRTDLAREIYVVAEVISNRHDTNLIGRVATAFADRFQDNGAGSIDVALVTRGDVRRDGSACLDPYDETAANRFCLPLVQRRWPAAPADGLWSERCPPLAPSCVSAPGGSHCQTSGRSTSRLPGEGDHFPADMAVFPNEGPDGPDPASRSLSRDFNDDEWWVVVDVCLEPGAGLFTGRLIHTSMQVLDFSGFILGSRAAWRSLHPRSNCLWCEP